MRARWNCLREGQEVQEQQVGVVLGVTDVNGYKVELIMREGIV